ncbi:MAG: glycosyltransferase family 39 protein [Anaerolineae bacterium]|nr:glycosyltransferase family 39 protein [Anaerolineae bacterium]
MKRPGVLSLWLVAILLLAAGLRVVNLGGRTLWYDEAFAVLYAETGLDAMLEGTLAQEDGAAADVHPLLYYTLLGAWMGRVGQSPEAVRALSVLVGVLTVAVVCRLAADLFGPRAGLAAGLIAALSPFHVQYAQEARMYALMALWLLLATWCFVRGWQGGGRRRASFYWLGFAVFAALAVYTQQLAAFYLLALALFPFVARRWDVCGRVVAAGLAALALYLPWLANLPGQLGKINQAYWVPPPGLAQAIQTLFAFAVPLLDLPQWILLGGLAVSMVLIALLALHVLRSPRARRAAGWRLGLAAWLAFAPPALMFVAGQFLPVYLLRALLPCALVFYVAVAWLVARGGVPRAIVGVVAALWLVVGGAGLLQHYGWDTFPNAPFDRAAAYLAEVVAPGT